MSMYGVPYAALEPGDGPGAKQSMADECNVNLIVERFEKTGLIDHLAAGVPQFVDASELGDYRSIIEQVRVVDEYFMGLPAQVRQAFGNDPRLFMDYLETKPSRDELESLGMEAIAERRRPAEDRRVSDVVVPEVPEVPEVAPEEPGTVPT